MLLRSLLLLIPGLSVGLAADDPLAYRSVATTHVAPKPSNVSTLWEFIVSRPDLSSLKTAVEQIGGFPEAFNTSATWKWTFFAPNNDAFANTGRYFSTFEATPKGKWWLGYTLIHHYVPNSNLKLANFNATYQRFQTATYLFVGAQIKDTTLVLNEVAEVVEGDIQVSNGVVHIIDKILDPSAQVYEPDHPWMHQSFIAGSCSNPNLPYC